MLRFPYLLSLLLCIEFSFCYNYIDEVTKHKINNLERNLRREKARWARRLNVRKSPLRQEEDYDRSPVEFDVASFIQPDDVNLETDEAITEPKNSKRRWTPKPFDFGSVLKSDDSNNNLEKTSDFMSMGANLPDLNINPSLSKDLLSAKHFSYNPLDDLNGKYGHEKFRNIYKDDLLLNHNAVHSHQKKCNSFKNIKFPFFSHNKSETLKPKKAKKRKLFFFKNSKKEAANIDYNKMNDDAMLPYRSKREEKLCPACKKIFLANMEFDRPKKRPNKIIHNSRQFYQNNPDATLKDELKDFRTNKIYYSHDRNRKKRDDRDRQLKELDEVQRKIDGVKILRPHFEAPAEKKPVFK